MGMNHTPSFWIFSAGIQHPEKCVTRLPYLHHFATEIGTAHVLICFDILNISGTRTPHF